MYSVPVSVCHVIHRKIGRANLCLRGVKKLNSALLHAYLEINELTGKSKLTYMYCDQLSNAWVFANKGLINPVQLTELFSIW